MNTARPVRRLLTSTACLGVLLATSLGGANAWAAATGSAEAAVDWGKLQFSLIADPGSSLTFDVTPGSGWQYGLARVNENGGPILASYEVSPALAPSVISGSGSGYTYASAADATGSLLISASFLTSDRGGPLDALAYASAYSFYAIKGAGTGTATVTIPYKVQASVAAGTGEFADAWAWGYLGAAYGANWVAETNKGASLHDWGGTLVDYSDPLQGTLQISFQVAADGVYEISALAGAHELASSAPVPEPETYALLIGGLGLLGVVVRRRKSR